MKKLRLLLCLPLLLIFTVPAVAIDVLIMVRPDHSAEQSVRDFGAWIESVRPGKYNIDFSADVTGGAGQPADITQTTGTSISTDQMALLESYDLVLMTRYGVGSSSDMASTDWNDLTTPFLLMNPFMVGGSRDRWDWIPEGTATPTSPPILEMVFAEPESPFLDGIDTSEGRRPFYFEPNTTMQPEVDDYTVLTGTTITWTDRETDSGELEEFPWLVYWDGSESSFYDGGTEAPAGPRVLLLGPLSNDPEEIRRDGLQVLVNAMSILTTGESDPGGLPPDPLPDYLEENFESYGEGSSVTSGESPWDVPDWAWASTQTVEAGESTNGDEPNDQILHVVNQGFGPITALRRVLDETAPDPVAGPLLSWSLKLRANDLDVVTDSSVVIGRNDPDLSDGSDSEQEQNLREDNAAAIRIVQGPDNEIRYVGGDGVATAIGSLQADAWYEASFLLDMDAQTYSLTVTNLDDPSADGQSFSVENVSFIDAVDRLDHVVILGESEEELDISLDDIFVLIEEDSSGATAFDEWVAQHFTPEEQGDASVSGADADPDGDNLSNLIEYVLGSDPRAPGDGNAPSSEIREVDVDGVTSSYLVLELTRVADLPDVNVSVQASGDLANWSPDAAVLVSSQENGDGTVTEVYRDSEPVGSGDRRFLRLEAELEP